MWFHLRWVLEPFVLIMDVVILSVPSHVDGARKDALVMLVLLHLHSRHSAQLFLAFRVARLYHTTLASLSEIVIHVGIGFLALVCLFIILLVVDLRDLGQ